MGISLLLKRLTAEEVKQILIEPSKLSEILKYPYKDYLDYWKSYAQLPDEEKKDKYDADKSWEPLNYLLSPDVTPIELELKLSVGTKKYYKIKLLKDRVLFSYGKGTLESSENWFAKPTIETKYGTTEECIRMVVEKLKEKLKEYQLQYEFTPKLTEEDLKEEEEEEIEDGNVGEKRKKVSKGKSKKIKITKNLSSATVDFLKMELEKRGVEVKGNKIDLMIALIFDIVDIKLPEKKTNFIMSGGKEIQIDMAYGHPRLLNANQVKQWLNDINEVSDEQLKVKYNPKKMEKEAIGPPNFYGDEEETWEYLLLHFHGLKKFLEETVQQENGLVLYLS
jgi:ribosomal protein S24E